ncbi:MAG: DcaP family trimeric outer membrane transporter, partial [Acidobacteriota bacterium]|nr:DcaP family trimeric outer membrane transporter [Acidobacteriota bacterium]
MIPTLLIISLAACGMTGGQAFQSPSSISLDAADVSSTATAAAGTPAATPAPATTDTLVPQPPPQADAAASTPQGFTFTVGGHFKPQAIFDFNPAGNTDFWDPRTIPVDGSTGQNFRVHARDTRLSLDVRGPAQGRDLRLFVETDFAEGTGYTLRLRHAYGSWGPLLAGQTWSTFMDELVIPNTIDLEPPMTFPFLRVAQMRLAHSLGAKGAWAVAIEDPTHKIDIPPGLDGKEEHPAPDVTGRLRWTGSAWHAQLSGFAGMVRFRPTSGSTQQRAIWGLALGGKTAFGGRTALGPRDALSAQVTAGRGVGRFRGGTVAAFDDAGVLRTVGAVGVLASYDHAWSDRFTSNASYGWVTGDTSGRRTTDATRSGVYATANLLWWFLPGRAWFGGEYLFGWR